jgi:predicted ATPase/DNA-binding transcriptional LysR family regulator
MQVEARLRAFAAVARTGSFSRAAEELYVSQPAVSKHVASLEAELGLQLVERRRSGATLTPAGESLADYVLRAEALLANARRAVGAEPETGALALAASGIPGTYLLPERLAEFHAASPAIEIDFRVLTSGEALERVRAHIVELAVVGGLDVPAELESEPLVEDELVLAGPPALGGRRLRAKDLAGHTWISREEGSSTRAAVEAARWQLGLHAVRTLELPSWEAVKLAVARGAGITAISRFALDLELQAGVLAILDVPRWRVTRTISVVRARGVPLTPPAERFLTLLRDVYAPEEEAVLPPNSNLPAQPNDLIGRNQDLDDVRRLLRTARGRLVTLTGAGGSGKTRLALEAGAALVNDFRDGVYLVELAPLADPSLVMPTILRTVGAQDVAEVAGRRMLLVIDNFEHLSDGAPAIAELLAATDRLRLLVTSRSPLALRGERLYDVPPLPALDAVALFVERALAVDEAFVDDGTVKAICERLDGLPLAIELAAARVRVFPPHVLLERLEQRLPVLVGGARNLPSRQRTLRGTIEWSHELLEEAARRAFAALAVFRGGWTIDAAAGVCGVEADTLQALVDQSLARRDAERYSMLETVREYALERLEEREDADALRRRHAEYFRNFAEEARTFARGPQATDWLDRTELELDNIRTALAWTIERSEGVLGLTLVEALEPYWYRRTQLREGLRWLEPLLELGADAPTAVRAGAFALAGRLASELGGDERVRPWYEQSLELARAAGDRRREAWALHGLGYLEFLEGNPAGARDLLEESYELFLALGDHAPAGGRLTYLAYIAQATGDNAAAREYLERSVDEYTAAGDAAGVVGSVASIAQLMIADGELDEALSLCRDVLAKPCEPRDRMLVFSGIAAVAAAQGEAQKAARLWGAAQRIDSELDQSLDDMERAVYEQALAAVADVDVEAGRALSDDEALTLARELAD